MLECIEKYTIADAKPIMVVIWLHGLGADYNDFVSLVAELKLNKCVKFVFPNAPMRPITINNNHVMRAWYDIRDYNMEANIDTKGINQSSVAIEELIQREIDCGFDATQIILGGFSQGGVISYTTGLSTQYQLGGIVALSCYFPDAQKVAQNADKFNKSLPIFAAHGISDPIIPYPVAEFTHQTLTRLGFNLSWHAYAMGHSLCPQEIVALSNWLNERISL